MTDEELIRALTKLKAVTEDLIENYQISRRAGEEVYIRLVVFRKLLLKYLTESEIEDAVYEYRTRTGQRPLNIPPSLSAILDGLGREAGHQGEKSGE